MNPFYHQNPLKTPFTPFFFQKKKMETDKEVGGIGPEKKALKFQVNDVSHGGLLLKKQ